MQVIFKVFFLKAFTYRSEKWDTVPENEGRVSSMEARRQMPCGGMGQHGPTNLYSICIGSNLYCNCKEREGKIDRSDRGAPGMFLCITLGLYGKLTVPFKRSLSIKGDDL